METPVIRFLIYNKNILMNTQIMKLQIALIIIYYKNES